MKTIFNSLRGANIQKTVAKSAGIFFCLVLLNSILYAQDSGKTLSETDTSIPNSIALLNYYDVAVSLTSVNDSKESALPEVYENETEKKLELEGWMLNANNFSAGMIQSETLKEDNLKLESWMTSELVWNKK